MNPNGQLNSSYIINIVLTLTQLVVVGLIGPAPNLDPILSAEGLPRIQWVLAVEFQVGKARGVKLLAEVPLSLHSGTGCVSTSALSETSVLSNIVFLFPTCACTLNHWIQEATYLANLLSFLTFSRLSPLLLFLSNEVSCVPL